MMCAQAGKLSGGFYSTQRKSLHAGFTLLGLLVEVIVVGLVSVVLLERLLYYQEYAEKTIMEVTIRNIRNGLQLRVADLMMHDKMKEVGNLLNDNPVTWLQAPPPNYLGEIRASKNNVIPRGNWYFDLERKELVYLPNHQRFFNPGADGLIAVRYQVHAIKYLPMKNDGVLNPEGITLNLMTQYSWKLAVQ